MLALKSHETIALFCSGSASPSEDDAKQTAEYLKQHGWNAIYDIDTYQKCSAKKRADIFLNYLFNDDVKALWALRGGEGTADIIPFINAHRDRIKALSPKMLIGYSDITALLLYFSQEFNWQVVHGTGALQLVKDHLLDDYKSQTCDLLVGRSKLISINKLTAFNSAANNHDKITAPLTGGNLSLLNISIGDSWEIDTKDKIVVIEDVAEYSHEIRRTLKYLDRLGKFKDAKAIIFGDFNCNSLGANTAEQTQNAAAILGSLKDFAKTLSIPVFFTDEVGHGKKNVPLIFNHAVTIVASNLTQTF